MTDIVKRFPYEATGYLPKDDSLFGNGMYCGNWLLDQFGNQGERYIVWGIVYRHEGNTQNKVMIKIRFANEEDAIIYRLAWSSPL